jgi:hypothetical protein
MIDGSKFMTPAARLNRYSGLSEQRENRRQKIRSGTRRGPLFRGGSETVKRLLQNGSSSRESRRAGSLRREVAAIDELLAAELLSLADSIDHRRLNN